MNAVTSHTISAVEFAAAVGSVPQDDDMERTNCPKAGEFGHSYCGWCEPCKKPRFICGHEYYRTDEPVRQP